jgi:hypothetical protein
MKERFQEYLTMPEEEKRMIWEKGIFVLDANVLLNMCRYSKQSSDELIGILKTYQKRIWLPYQVALEFFNNRLSVIAGINNGFDKLIDKIGNIDGVLEKELNLKEFKSEYAVNTPEIKKEISAFQKRLGNKLKKWKNEFAQNDKESILGSILSLYEGKVGNDYPPDHIKELFKEGEDRYREFIPPGFADYEGKKKKGKRHLYGDLIWWKQAMDYAKSNKYNLVIVTDDEKEDWWYEVSGKTVGPRVELIREFIKETGGQKFLMYKTHQFMEMARTIDGADVSDSSITEAKTTGSTDINEILEYLDDVHAISRSQKVDPTTILGGGGTFVDHGFLSGLGYQGIQGAVKSLRFQNFPWTYSPQRDLTMTELMDYYAKHNGGFTSVPDLISDEVSREDLIRKLKKINKKKDDDKFEEVVE